MLLVSWVNLAILHSVLAMPVPETQLGLQPAQLQRPSAAHGEVALTEDDIETQQLDDNLDAPDVFDFKTTPFYGGILDTFKEGVVLYEYEEGSARWSKFTVRMLGGPVWSSMTAVVSF